MIFPDETLRDKFKAGSLDVPAATYHLEGIRSSSLLDARLSGPVALPSFRAVIFGRIKSRKATTTRMAIVRLREANCNQDKELPDIESKRLRCRPSRAHLLASIAHLRHKSSTKMLKDSKKLLQQSSQVIVETEFSLRADD